VHVVVSALRRVLRSLTGPLTTPRRFDALTELVERRLDRLESHTLRALSTRQEQLGRQLGELAEEQERLRRTLNGEDVSEQDVPRKPFGGPLPLEVAPDEPADETPGTDCPPGPIERLEQCPVCASPERSIVCRFNKMITMRQMPDAKAARYDYALCHACGLVYASRRPAGARFAWLLEHFEESLGRVGLGERRSGKITLSSYELDDEGRARLRALASRGAFVSEHVTVGHKDHLWQLEEDRLANSRHVELIGSLVTLNAPRVLEVRSRLGSISASLRRLYGAEVFTIPLFPNQRLLIQEVYGIPADAKLEFDRFTVPYPGPFDLVVSNHMLTHTIRPGEYLETVRESLVSGGHLYIFNEPFEDEFLHREKSMFNTLNAFHLQTFDRDSLVRMLEASGFKVVHIRRDGGNFSCLARKVDGPAAWTPMSEDQRCRRLTLYRRAYEMAVLLLPDYARPRFAARWPKVLESARSRGIVGEDAQGRLRVLKRKRPTEGG